MPRVARIEVKRCFVVSEKGKDLAGLADEEFRTRLVDLTNQTEEMAEMELDAELVTQPAWRIEDYNSLAWTYSTVPIDRAGVWFRAGNLPDEFCIGSVRDTANLLLSRGVESLANECKARTAIPQMVRVAEAIAGERLLSVIAVRGGRHRPTPPCTKMEWDLDDGSHRAIALALSGKTRLNAYLGVPSELVR